MDELPSSPGRHESKPQVPPNYSYHTSVGKDLPLNESNRGAEDNVPLGRSMVAPLEVSIYKRNKAPPHGAGRREATPG